MRELKQVIENTVCLWDRLKEANKPIVLYGMGDGAQKIIDVLSGFSLAPSAVMASDDFCRGQSFAGFKVQKYSEIKQMYDDFLVLVCFGTPLADVIERIVAISAERELYAPDVPVTGGGLFTKRYALENIDKLQAVYDALADEKSRAVYLNWIEYRISGDLTPLLKEQTDKCEAYSLLQLTDSEIYADLGAYNGDTIAEFLEATDRQFCHIYALEPDIKNYTKLCKRHDGIIPNLLTAVNAGAWCEDTVMTFAVRAGRNSSLTPYQKGLPLSAGKLRDIEMRSLDSVVAGNRVSLIKIDVEGSDKNALIGCRETIAKYKPKMIVSLYHRTEDIFDLPLYIKSVNPDYSLYLRQQRCIPAWDMNLYVI